MTKADLPEMHQLRIPTVDELRELTRYLRFDFERVIFEYEPKLKLPDWIDD